MADTITADTADEIDAQFAAEKRAKRLGKAAPGAKAAAKPAAAAAAAPPSVSSVASTATGALQGATQAVSAATPSPVNLARNVASLAVSSPDYSAAHVLSSEETKKQIEADRAALRMKASGAAKINRYYARFPDCRPLSTGPSRAVRNWSAHDSQNDIDAELLRIYEIRNGGGNEDMCRNLVLGMFSFVGSLATPKDMGGYGLLPVVLSDMGEIAQQNKATLEPELTEMSIELADWFTTGWQGRLLMKMAFVAHHSYRLKTDPVYAQALMSQMKRAREASAGKGEAAAAAAAKDL
jgi:hypothetical protein